MANKQIRVLIGDDSAASGVAWARSLMHKGMYAVTRQKNGRVLLDALKSGGFDAVVMEAKMPELDAASLMTEMRSQLAYAPAVVVISNYDSPQTEIEVMEAGAAYYMVKPFEPSVLAAKIETMLDGGAVDNIECAVTDIIHQIGIPAHIKGYHYVRTAIMLSAENAEMIARITKLLYPTVAKQYSTTSARVARAIRHTIVVAWERGNADTLNSLFGYTIRANKSVPTNSEVIALIADKIRLRFKYTDS